MFALVVKHSVCKGFLFVRTNCDLVTGKRSCGNFFCKKIAAVFLCPAYGDRYRKLHWLYVMGMTDTILAPDKKITREQIAALIDM